MKKATWESFLALKDKKDIFLDLEHYLSELYKWTKDNSSRFNKELLARNRIDVILELDNVLDYLGCDAEIYLDKEVERVFKNMPKKEELFLMCLGSTLWDLLRETLIKAFPAPDLRCKAA